MEERRAYPSDVSDDEWVFVAPYLTLMKEDAPQRDHDLREVFNGLRYILRTGMERHCMPNDLPPWYTVYHQTQRWVKVGCFAWMARIRRLVRDYERLAETLAGLHFIAFAMLKAHRFVSFMAQSA